MKKILFLLMLLPIFGFGQSEYSEKRQYRDEQSYEQRSYRRSPRYYIAPGVRYVMPSDVRRIYRNKYNYYRPYTLYGDWRYRERFYIYDEDYCD